MKAAVIGAGGYIARNFLYVNRMERYAEVTAYGHSPAHIDGIPNYRQIDLSCGGELEQAIADRDLIYFFTGKTGTLQGFDRPEEYTELNENALLRLLNAYRAAGCRGKIVFPSTRLVYRGSEGSLEEDAPKEWLTPYAMQKFACERYLEMYHRLYGVRYCVLRICVPYGTLVEPVSSYGTLDMFLRQARENGRIGIYGDGQQKRTLTYIEDLCRVMWLAGLSEDCENDVFNVGGETLSIRQLAEQVAAATGAAVTETPWPELARKTESGSTVFNSRKLDDRLGYTYKMTVGGWIEAMIGRNDMVKIGNRGGGSGIQ